MLASGPVIVTDGKVLLNKHGEDTFWKFCGGRVKDLNQEGLIAAAQREAQEEIGAKVEIINPVPFILHVVRIINGEEVDIILAHYLAELLPGQEVTPGEDIREVAWLDLEKLDQEDLGPNIRPTLKHFGFLG